MKVNSWLYIPYHFNNDWHLCSVQYTFSYLWSQKHSFCYDKYPLVIIKVKVRNSLRFDLLYGVYGKWSYFSLVTGKYQLILNHLMLNSFYSFALTFHCPSQVSITWSPRLIFLWGTLSILPSNRCILRYLQSQSCMQWKLVLMLHYFKIGISLGSSERLQTSILHIFFCLSSTGCNCIQGLNSVFGHSYW